MPEWVYGIVLGVIAAGGGWYVSRYGRIATLEKRLALMEGRERQLWNYCRELIDHIYRGRGAPPPTPPKGIFGEEE